MRPQKGFWYNRNLKFRLWGWIGWNLLLFFQGLKVKPILLYGHLLSLCGKLSFINWAHASLGQPENVWMLVQAGTNFLSNVVSTCRQPCWPCHDSEQRRQQSQAHGRSETIYDKLWSGDAAVVYSRFLKSTSAARVLGGPKTFRRTKKLEDQKT